MEYFEKLRSKEDEVSKAVISWFEKHGDSFPWRSLSAKTSPWKIAVGEVLLNRVTAERVLPVFQKIITEFPSPCDLNKAPLENLVLILSSLGLQEKKAKILKKLSTVFCEASNLNQIKDRLQLIKGIGKNTYNAILLFGFNEKRPLMDGVIGRVLGRVFGIKWKGKAVTDSKAWGLSEKLIKDLSVEETKKFYYGILDLGRKICRKNKPNCTKCPLCNFCLQAIGLNNCKAD